MYDYMKQIIYSSINLLFLSLFLCSFTFTVNAGIHSADRTNEKIELQRDGTTRPGFVFNVEAYKNGTSIDLFVENYTGSVEILIQQSTIYNMKIEYL